VEARVKRICVTIGIARAESLGYLPGALSASEQIGDWAARSGFDKIAVVTDKDMPVTISRLREVFTGLLQDDGSEIEAFVLHFAGHGFRTGAEQNLWLPSDWHSELRAIAVEALRNKLYRHGIKNLTIFSDACRSLPNTLEITELTPDAILGRGPYDAVPPIIDRYNAVADGQQAFMIPGQPPDKGCCIFSTALLEGLWGHRADAFDKHLLNLVTPESLDLFLRSRLHEIGTKYRLNCRPDNMPGTPRDHFIYFDKGRPPPEMPAPPSWPEPVRVVEESRAARPRTNVPIRDDLIVSYRGSANRLQARAQQVARESALSRASEIFRQAIRGNRRTGQLIILEDRVSGIWSGSTSKTIGAPHWTRCSFSFDRNDAVQALVQFEDGIFTSVIVYSNLITLMTRDAISGPRWTCINPGDRKPDLDRSIDAIGLLERGDLTASRVDDLTIGLRGMKHVNPTLGAAASYLYDYSGDIDSIRRMAFYYADCGQSMPFDVAFMGMLKGVRRNSYKEVIVPAVEGRSELRRNAQLPDWVSDPTPATRGKVAGAWPWFRQGWDFVDEPENEETPVATPIQGLSPFLLNSAFTSFSSEGGRVAINMLRLEKSK
jgi:hypothetical protein